MAVPKHKVSRSKRGHRRSQKNLTAPNLVPCDNCGEKKLPHRVCPSCGYYNGREVIGLEELED